MGAIASQITSLMIVYSIVYSDADQRKHQSSPLLAFVRGIHRGPVNSPHKRPVTRNVSPFDDVIMCQPQMASVYLKHDMWKTSVKYYPYDWICKPILQQSYTSHLFAVSRTPNNKESSWLIKLFGSRRFINFFLCILTFKYYINL